MSQPQEETQEYRRKLSAADAARIARLTEEVRGRLEEMAAITARVIGIPLGPDAVRKFVPHQPDEARSLDSPTVVEVEILDDFLGPGTRPCCLVSLSDGDWFVECPCGAADAPGGTLGPPVA